MEPLSEAIDIFRHAEDELRNLLLRVAGEGEYDQAVILADWARQLRQIREHVDSAMRNGEELESLSHFSEKKLASQKPTQSAPQNGTPNRRKAKKAARGGTKKTDYPRFHRDRDELVKIGWSKKKKTEYRHKAPKSTVLSVAESLQKLGRGGERFTVEELLPFRDRDSQAELPSYQAYLTLAWLRKENLILQHGRQGYSLPPNINLMDELERRWKLLPKA